MLCVKLCVTWHGKDITVLCIKANEGSSAVMSVVVNLVNLMLFLSYLGQYREARLKIIERERMRGRESTSLGVMQCRQ